MLPAYSIQVMFNQQPRYHRVASMGEAQQACDLPYFLPVLP